MFYTINNHLYKKNNAFVGSAHIDFTRYLTLIQSNGGTITASNLTGYAGDTSNLSYTANPNYYFQNWSNTGGNIQGNTFTYDEGNASIQGNFKQIELYNYSGVSANKAADYDIYDGRIGHDVPYSARLQTLKVDFNNPFAYKVTISNSSPKDMVFFDFLSTGASFTWNKETNKFDASPEKPSSLVGGISYGWAGALNWTSGLGNNDVCIFRAIKDPVFKLQTSPELTYLYYDANKCYTSGIEDNVRVMYRNYWSGDKTTIKYIWGSPREIQWDIVKHYQRPISAYVNGEFVCSGYNNHSFLPYSAVSVVGITSGGFTTGGKRTFYPCTGFRNIEFAQFTNQDDAGHW